MMVIAILEMCFNGSLSKPLAVVLPNCSDQDKKSPLHCSIESLCLHKSTVHIECPLGSHAEPANCRKSGWRCAPGLVKTIARTKIAIRTTRFTVPMSSLPGRQVRCCIKDSSTGATRFEALWGDKRRVLVDVADSGSIGFASLLFLFAHCKIRGCHFPDPLHRLHDDHNNAITASGLASMKTERIIVSNHKNGPWKQARNFLRFQDAAMEYFSSANANDELCVLMSPYIVADLWRGQLPSDAGTPVHYDFVWRMLPDLDCFGRTGESTKGGRWYQLAHKSEHTMKYDSATLLVLLYCGITSGSFTKMADAPLPGGSHLVDLIAEPAPTPSGADGDEREAETHGAPKPPSPAPPSKPVALSSYQADLRERVARDINTLVARILADRLSRAFAVVYTTTADDDVAYAAWCATAWLWISWLKCGTRIC